MKGVRLVFWLNFFLKEAVCTTALYSQYLTVAQKYCTTDHTCIVTLYYCVISYEAYGLFENE